MPPKKSTAKADEEQSVRRSKRIKENETNTQTIKSPTSKRTQNVDKSPPKKRLKSAQKTTASKEQTPKTTQSKGGSVKSTAKRATKSVAKSPPKKAISPVKTSKSPVKATKSSKKTAKAPQKTSKSPQKASESKDEPQVSVQTTKKTTKQERKSPIKSPPKERLTSKVSKRVTEDKTSEEQSSVRRSRRIKEIKTNEDTETLELPANKETQPVEKSPPKRTLKSTESKAETEETVESKPEANKRATKRRATQATAIAVDKIPPKKRLKAKATETPTEENISKETDIPEAEEENVIKTIEEEKKTIESDVPEVIDGNKIEPKSVAEEEISFKTDWPEEEQKKIEVQSIDEEKTSKESEVIDVEASETSEVAIIEDDDEVEDELQILTEDKISIKSEIPKTEVKKTEPLILIEDQKISLLDIPKIPQIGGKVYSFGDEIAGELGPREKHINGVKVKKNEPSVISGIDDTVVQVVCGAMHTVCLTIKGEVVTFGCNDDAALGRNTSHVDSNLDESDESVDDSEEIAAKTPQLVTGLGKIVKVSAGDMHTVALSDDGSVFVWGNFKDDSKKLGLTHDTVNKLDSDGKPSGDYNETIVPKLVESLGSTKIVDIASGCHHILLLTEKGEVLSFGEGSKGQLGRIPKEKLQSVNSDRQLFLIPQKIEFEDSVVIEKIWSSHWSSFALSTTGDIYVWGLNNFHQLGFKTENPIELLTTDPNESQQTMKIITELRPIKATKMPLNIKMIANGQHHTLALDTTGQIYVCGSSTYGKLGLGLVDSNSSDDQTVESPRPISRDAFNGERVTHIACGEFCSFAITENGRFYSWGQGSKQIGTDEWQDLTVPTRVKGLVIENTRFLSVSSGSQHSALVGYNLTINGN